MSCYFLLSDLALLSAESLSPPLANLLLYELWERIKLMNDLSTDWQLSSTPTSWNRRTLPTCPQILTSGALISVNLQVCSRADQLIQQQAFKQHAVDPIHDLSFPVQSTWILVLKKETDVEVRNFSSSSLPNLVCSLTIFTRKSCTSCINMAICCYLTHQSAEASRNEA